MERYIFDSDSILYEPAMLSGNIPDTEYFLPASTIKDLSSSTALFGTNELYKDLINSASNLDFITVERRPEEIWAVSERDYDPSKHNEELKTFLLEERPNNAVLVSDNDDLKNVATKIGIKTISPKEVKNRINENTVLKKIVKKIKKFFLVKLIKGAILGAIPTVLFALFITRNNFLPQSINFIISTITVPSLGIGLFWLRSRKRFYYGIAELIFGVFIPLNTLYPSFNLANANSAEIIKIVGGLYIIVRAMDNIGKGLTGSEYKRIWNKFFRIDVLSSSNSG
jgi:hypothetical protein